MQKVSPSLPLTCLALGSLGCAQAEVESVPLTPLEPATPVVQQAENQIQALMEDPHLVQGVLDNGMRYLIRPTAEPAGRASIRLYVESGSLDESPETSGLSHFLEHLLFNGSRHYERGELIPAMQKKGLTFGTDVNAYTGFLQTVFMLDLPELSEETVDFCMTILRDFADGATMTDEAIDKERGIIVSELKTRDSEAYRAGIKGLEQLTEGTRLTTYTPIGDVNVIKKAPYEAFRKIYRDHYTADRVVVLITGDVKAEQAEAWVQKHFGDMPATKGVPRYQFETPKTGASTYIIPNPESSLAMLSIAFVKPFEKKPDTMEQRIADLPIQLACSMLNKRLQRMAKQEDASFIQAQASRDDLFFISEVLAIMAMAKEGQHAEALACIEQELRRACQYGFQESELQEVIASTHLAYQSACESWPTTTSSAMATRLIGNLDDFNTMTDPQEDLRSFEEGVKAILANPALCQQAMQALYAPDRAKLTVSGKIPEGLDAAMVEKIYADSLTQKVAAPVTAEVQSFAYDKVGEAGSIVKQELLEDVGITTITLSNGIKVNLKPLDFKKGSINVNIALDGGALRLSPQAGLADLASMVMNVGGLDAHSMEDLKRILAGKNVAMNFKANAESFDISATTRMADLDLQCKLLAAMIMHPGYRDEAERMFRLQIPAFFNRLKATPDGMMGLYATRFLFGEDDRLTVPLQEDLEACTTADVKAALAPFLKDAAMEVSLVGDFKVEEVLPILEQTFAAMPQRKESFTPLSEEMRKASIREDVWGELKFIPYDTELDKTLVAQVHAVGDGSDLYRNRRLLVLRAIVREKLFDSLRATLGESYGPSVDLVVNQEFDDAAFFMCSSSGVKANREKVAAAMDCTLTQIGQGTITKEDFERAYLPLLSTLDKQLRDTDFWTKSVNKIQSDERKLAMLRDLKSDFASITYEEVLALSKEIFGNPKSTKLFVVPSDYEQLPENAK